MSLLLIILGLAAIAALAHAVIRRRLIANLTPACLVCTALVAIEVLVVKPAQTALGGLVLPFVFMAVLIVSLFVGMVMNLLRISAFARHN